MCLPLAKRARVTANEIQKGGPTIAYFLNTYLYFFFFLFCFVSVHCSTCTCAPFGVFDLCVFFFFVVGIFSLLQCFTFFKIHIYM